MNIKNELDNYSGDGAPSVIVESFEEYRSILMAERRVRIIVGYESAVVKVDELQRAIENAINW